MSELDSVRNTVDAVKGLNSDTNVKDIDFFSLKPLTKLDRKSSYGSWCFRAGGRLTKTLSRQFSLNLDDELYDESAADWGQRRSSSRSRRVLVAAVLAALLAGFAGSAVRSFNHAAAPAAAGVPGIAQYVHGIAAWHEGSSGQTADHYDLDTMYRMCGQAKLPAIQLAKQSPPAVTWQPDGTYPTSALDELALDCGAPKHAAACNTAAAASNAYEGEQLPLMPEDLAAHEFASQAMQDSSAADTADTWQELTRLNLDCKADPSSCAAAQQSNSYSADDGSSSATPGSHSFEAAATEAAAYLLASHAPNGWDTIIGGAADAYRQLLDGQQAAAAVELSSNSYEGAEAVWVQRRIAEEAAAQYIDALQLALDCSMEKHDGPTAHECERSRAVNKYEVSAKTQESIPQVGGIEIQVQRFPDGMRTVGYDAPAVDWTEYGTAAAGAAAAGAAAAGVQLAEQAADSAGCKAGSGGCSCGHAGAHKHAAKQQQPPTAMAAQAGAAAKVGLTAERLQSLQQQLQDIAQQRRVVGYNVPALDQQQLLLQQLAAQKPGAAAAAAAAAVVGPSIASTVQKDALLHARKYFKSPCNNPEGRQQYKSTQNHPWAHSHYKNPANAPVHVQEAPQQMPSTQPAQNTSPSTMLAAAAVALSSLLTPAWCVLMTAAAAVAGTWHVVMRGNGSSRRRQKRVAPLTEVQEEEAGAGCSDNGSPDALHPSPSNNLLVAAGCGSGGLASPPGTSQPVSRTASGTAQDAGQLGLPPSLLTCASTVLEPSFDADEDAAAAAIAAERAGAGVRVSQLDDVPEAAVDSPRVDARCDSPFRHPNLQK